MAVSPIDGLALVAMVLCPLLGSRQFSFFGFAFFFRDFGAELNVFFVFDRAAFFFGFDLDFVPVFAFVFPAGFGFVVCGQRDDAVGIGRRRHRSRRGGGEQRQEQEDREEEVELAHRPLLIGGGGCGL